MPRDYPPPSKAERERLVKERQVDPPRPAPMLRPAGSIGALIDAQTAKRRADTAVNREKRIRTIDDALKARESQAKSGWTKAQDKGLSRPSPDRSGPKPTRGPTR